MKFFKEEKIIYENKARTDPFILFQKIRNLKISLSQKIAAAVFVSAFKIGVEVHEIKQIRERDEITIHIDKDGNREYQHSDEQTTQYLDYLTGKKVHRAFLKRMMAHQYIIEENISSYRDMDQSEIDSLAYLDYQRYIQRYKELYEVNCEIEKNLLRFIKDEEKRGLKSELLLEDLKKTRHLKDSIKKELVKMEEIGFKNFIDEELEELNTVITDGFNRDYYEFIWRLEKENGKPRIRSVVEQQQSKRTPYRAYYHSRNNTMHVIDPIFLSLGEEDSDFFAELAHAQQFVSGPYHKILLKKIHDVIDDYKILKRVLMDTSETNLEEKRFIHQLEEYDDPSTIEYEAHKIIEKIFRKQKDSILHIKKEFNLKKDE